MDSPGKEGPSREHDCARPEPEPKLGDHARCAVAFHDDVVNRLLEKLQVRLIFEATANRLAVKNAIRLCACSANCGTLGRIQGAPLDARGIRTSAYLYETGWALHEHGMSSVAILVLMTVILVPAMQLAAMLYMLVSLKLGQAPRHLAAAFRIVHHAQPWGMVEVFILGSLVSLVKITQVADVEAYGGIYCLGGYVLALAAALGAFEPHEVWERARALGSRFPAVEEARA
jgi:hypothetical protein